MIEPAGIAQLIERLSHADAQVRRIAAMDLTHLAGDPAARGALWRVYADPATPARVAHAAILAHDESLTSFGQGPGR